MTQKTFIGTDAYERFCEWTDDVDLQKGEVGFIIFHYYKLNILL